MVDSVTKFNSYKEKLAVMEEFVQPDNYLSELLEAKTTKEMDRDALKLFDWKSKEIR